MPLSIVLKEWPKLLKLRLHFRFLPVVLLQALQTFPKRKNGLRPFLTLWKIVLMKMKKRTAERFTQNFVLMKMKKRTAKDFPKILFSFTVEDLSDLKTSRFSY
jgi:hypothetical protein